MRPPRVFVIAAALTLGAALSALPAQMASAQSPSTSVLVPSSGATLIGSTYLDASATNATNVEFMLFGGTYGYGGHVVCTATLTYYGWLCSWNTSFVPNGTYALLSYAFEAGGSAFSSGVSVTVNDPPRPSTTVLVPASGATLDTAQNEVFDASASAGVAKVSIELTLGGDTTVTFTATPTFYGWIAVVQGAPCGPDCSSASLPASIQSVASYSDGDTGTSPPVNVTIIAYIKTPP